MACLSDPPPTRVSSQGPCLHSLAPRPLVHLHGLARVGCVPRGGTGHDAAVHQFARV